MKQTSAKDTSTNSKPGKRGGAGRGQGLKPAGAEAVKTYQVYLMPADAERIKKKYGGLTTAIKTTLPTAE